MKKHKNKSIKSGSVPYICQMRKIILYVLLAGLLVSCQKEEAEEACWDLQVRTSVYPAPANDYVYLKAATYTVTQCGITESEACLVASTMTSYKQVYDKKGGVYYQVYKICSWSRK